MNNIYIKNVEEKLRIAKERNERYHESLKSMEKLVKASNAAFAYLEGLLNEEANIHVKNVEEKLRIEKERNERYCKSIKSMEELVKTSNAEIVYLESLLENDEENGYEGE